MVLVVILIMTKRGGVCGSGSRIYGSPVEADLLTLRVAAGG